VWFVLPAMLAFSCASSPSPLALVQPPTTTATSVAIDSTINLTDGLALTKELPELAILRADFVRTISLRTQCGRTPDRCQVDDFALPGSELNFNTTTLMRERTVANIRSRAGSGVLRFRIESLQLHDTLRASVHTCTYDSVVLFDSGQLNNTADDIVFNNHVMSRHAVWKLEMHGGHWKWASVEVLDSFFGGDICGF
jgi:hypothetical protein